MREGELVLFGCLGDFESKLGKRWSSNEPALTIGELLAEFLTQAPEMSEIVNSAFFKVAVNNKVEPRSFALNNGDTVALLPPVTGG